MEGRRAQQEDNFLTDEESSGSSASSGADGADVEQKLSGLKHGPHSLRRYNSATINMPHYRAYEIWSLSAVALSVALTVLESISTIQDFLKTHLLLQRVFTGVFALLGVYFVFDYVWRLRCDGCAYACSFFGAVDFFGAAAVVPEVLEMVFGIQTFERNCGAMLRAVRLLRAFRVLKMSRFVDELHRIRDAITSETRAILVLQLTVCIALLFVGSTLYVVESHGGPGHGSTPGFESIPSSIWWAIVTLTTVGYGDTVPQTFLGRLIACGIMLLGYSTLAVPTITSVLVSTHGSGKPEDSATSGGPSRLTGMQEMQPIRAAPMAAPDLESSNNSTLKSYPFKVLLPLRRSDMNELGFVRASSISLLVEEAVQSLLQCDQSGTSPRPVTSQIACTLLQPVQVPETLETGVLLEEMEASSATFLLGLFGRSSGRLCAMGRLQVRWLDAATHQPLPMPAHALRACERASSGRSPSRSQASTLSPPKAPAEPAGAAGGSAWYSKATAGSAAPGTPTQRWTCV